MKGFRKVNYQKSIAFLNPALLEEWNYAVNDKINIKPEEVSPGSNIEVSWKCSKCNYVRYQKVSSRKYVGCANCAGLIVNSTNSLEATHPEVAIYWNYHLNHVSPSEVHGKSTKTAHFVCNKNDAHTWTNVIGAQVKSNYCPYCESFKEKYPELYRHVDVKRNDMSKVDLLKPGSNKKIWFNCDACGELYEKSVFRAVSGSGCPKCSSKVSKPIRALYGTLREAFDNVELEWRQGEYVVDIYIKDINLAIEYDGAYFHKERTLYDLDKSMNLMACGVNLLRIREEGLDSLKAGVDEIFVKMDRKDEIEKLNLMIHLVSEYIKNRFFTKKELNPLSMMDYYSVMTKRISLERSLKGKFTHLAKEWDYEKNGTLTPETVTAGTNQKFYWRCEDKNHSFESTIQRRLTAKHSCPICADIRVTDTFNLRQMNPLLSKDWHPVKNGALKPDMVTPNYGKKVWWKCHKCEKEWETTVKLRVSGTSCPKCAVEKNSILRHRPDIVERVSKIEGDLSIDLLSVNSSRLLSIKCDCGEHISVKTNSISIKKSDTICTKCKSVVVFGKRD